MNLFRPPLLLLLVAPLLGGCLQTVTSVAGSECKIFTSPQYEVRGATQHDQDWIDPAIEGGVGGCHWKRPAPRPAEWDASPSPKSRAVTPVKKVSVFKRIWPSAAVTPVTQTPEAPVTPAPVAAAPRAPCRPIDELLRSCGK